MPLKASVSMLSCGVVHQNTTAFWNKHKEFPLKMCLETNVRTEKEPRTKDPSTILFPAPAYHLPLGALQTGHEWYTS